MDAAPLMTKAEVLAAIDRTRAAWRSAVERIGERHGAAGAAGEWSMRDVLAHANAYLRFVTDLLGGSVRPFGEMPDDLGDGFQARNEWLHAADLHLPWDDVVREHREVLDELVRQVERRSDDELRKPLVEWAPLTATQWVVNLTEGHWYEHRADVETHLAV